MAMTMLQGKLVEGVADRGSSKSPNSKWPKAMHHLLMELGLKRRRIVAIGSMKTSHWPMDREADLRGGLCISMKAPWPVAMQACIVTRESRALHGEARTSRPF